MKVDKIGANEYLTAESPGGLFLENREVFAVEENKPGFRKILFVTAPGYNPHELVTIYATEEIAAAANVEQRAECRGALLDAQHRLMVATSQRRQAERLEREYERELKSAKDALSSAIERGMHICQG